MLKRYHARLYSTKIIYFIAIAITGGYIFQIYICNDFSPSLMCAEYQIITNASNPKNGSKRIILKEDIVIRKEEKGKNNSVITDIHINTAGQIYTLSMDGSIRIYNNRGNAIRSMKVGNPNSNIDYYSCFEISRENRIYLAELNRLLVYNSQGLLINTINMSDNINDFSLAPNGEIFAFVTTEERYNEIVHYDQKGKRIKKYYSEAKKKMVQIKDSKGGTHLFAEDQHEYAWRLIFSSNNNGSAVFGNSGEYRINVLNTTSADPMIISKQDLPEKIGNDETEDLIRGMSEPSKISGGVIARNDILSAINIPPHKPYFSILYVDTDGKVYAVRLTKEKKWSIDVFNKHGIFIENLQLEFIPIVKIIDGKMYCHTRNSPGTITRYAMEIVK